jgi:hypothetical protein
VEVVNGAGAAIGPAKAMPGNSNFRVSIPRARTAEGHFPQKIAVFTVLVSAHEFLEQL